MLVYETLDPHGDLNALHLERSKAGLELVSDSYRVVVAPRLIIKVMRRYGRGLDPSVSPDGECLELDDGIHLQRFRFRAAVDAEGRDYLALVEDQNETICVMASHLGAALDHLARAGSDASPPSTDDIGQ